MKRFKTVLLLVSVLLSCVSFREKIVQVPKERVDGNLTLDMLDASIQTYRHFNGDRIIPSGAWIFNGEMFYGDDFFGSSEKQEFYGIVLRSKLNPGEIMFAFRGTVTAEEWWDYMHIGLEPFVPKKPGIVLPDGLKVEKGFNLIYMSLREQLFSYIDDIKPSKVYITGHSLGSALSELFVFDLSLSCSEIIIASTNFACPRLGNKFFVDHYRTVVRERTLRVVNLEDIVPKIPLEWEGYEHLPYQLTVNFRSRTGVIPNYGLRHSADNYYRALQDIFYLQDRTCHFVNKKMDDIVILDD